jgi:hypothetical protein
LSRSGARAIAIVLATTAVAPGCGGDGGDGARGERAETPRVAQASRVSWDVRDVKTLFSQAVGIRLDETRLHGVTALAQYYDEPLDAVHRLYRIYVTDGGRQLEQLTSGKPASGGVYWHRERRRTWVARKRFDNLILEWATVPERRTNEQWDRLVAIVRNLGKPRREYTRIPQEEIPCERAGIAPSGPGKEGSCLLGGQTLTIVNRDRGLNLRHLRLDRVRGRVARRAAAECCGEQPHRPDRGRFLLVRYRIVNTGTKVIGSNAFRLVLGDRRIKSDYRVESSEQVLGAGEQATWVSVFDLTPATAKRATRAGALEVGNVDGASDPEYVDSVARLRLSPP